jgi:chitinase
MVSIARNRIVSIRTIAVRMRGSLVRRETFTKSTRAAGQVSPFMHNRTVLVFLSIVIAASALAEAAPAKRRGAGSVSATLQYVVAYDSALQGDWSIARWDDAEHFIEIDPGAPAPDRAGSAIEVRFSQNGWGAFGLANMTDWNNVHYMYLNEFKTIEFDFYIEPDSTGIENLHFILDDSGYSNEPRLVSFIEGWDPAHPGESAGRWIPVRIDLSRIGATVPRFTRFLLHNRAWPSRPHFRMANVRLGWTEDTAPPAFLSVTATPSLTYDRLTLAFHNDKATTYRVEYGAGDYRHLIDGNPSELSPNHQVMLTGLSRGNTYQYRISAWPHHNPSDPPAPGVYTGTYTMPALPAAPPGLSAFAATPAEIVVGASARLTWSVADYDTLTIDPGVGSVAEVHGSTGVLVHPAETTTYTITAANAIGSKRRAVTILAHSPPTVRSFAATPARIAAGGTSLLMWDVGDANTITIDHGIGDVSSREGAAGLPVNPTDTTTYVLTASNAYGTVRQTTTLSIDTPATNPIWVMGYYIGYHRALQPPDKVDYSAMTHIILGPAIPTTSGAWETHFYVGDVEGPAWAKETVQRAHAADIKAILMLGGAGQVDGFLATSNPAVRAAFVRNLKAIVEEYGFDGVDLDWEPIGPGDRTTALALMEALQAPGALPRGSYIYTLPVGWNNMNWDNMADPFFGEIAAYFDRVSPMTYSMMWIGDGWQSWHTGALYGETPNAPSSIDDTVQALRAAGIPPSKIGIGIGFYGDAVENGAWTSSGWRHLDPPAIPSYVTGPHQSTDHAFWRHGDNALSYSNIMRYLHSGTAYRWDEVARVPYLSFSAPESVAIPGYTTDMRASFVTYDNEQSIAEKGSYARRNGLGGVMIWAISEGYLGNWKTSGEPDPLMKAVVEAFRH